MSLLHTVYSYSSHSKYGISTERKCPCYPYITHYHSTIGSVTNPVGSAGHFVGMTTSTPNSAMTKSDLPRLMTRAEVAEYLGVAINTIRNWNSAGVGPRPIKYGAKSVMYLPEDVYDWLYELREA